MKKYVRTAILLFLAVILLTLIIVPANLISETVTKQQGIIRNENGYPGCYCPFKNLECWCFIRDPEPDN